MSTAPPVQARIRRSFERWLKRYWRGIKWAYFADINEYDDRGVQMAWEVWQKWAGEWSKP